MCIRVENPYWEELLEKTKTLDSRICENPRLENTNGKLDEATILAWDGLVGIEIQDAKRDVLRAVNYFEGMKKELEEKERQGKKISADDFTYLNMLFFGALGTGKTTIANLVGKLMHAKGMLPTSKVHIVQASALGSGTVHGVQEKLFEEAEKAVGGVLLIDDLQAIGGVYQGGDLVEDFMHGLVSVIDKHRDNMCVILCGYEEVILRIFQYDVCAFRRFPRLIKFEGYSIDTLMEILSNLLKRDGKKLGEGVEEKVRKIILADMKTQGKTFGNVGYLKYDLIAKLKTAYFERDKHDGIYTMEDLNEAFPNKFQAIYEEDEKCGSTPYYKRVYNSTYNEARRRTKQLLKEQRDKLRKEVDGSIGATKKKLLYENELALKEHQEVDALSIFDKTISEFEEKILSIANSHCCNNTIESDDGDCVNKKVVALKYHQLLESLVSGFDGQISENSETVRIKEGLVQTEYNFLAGDYEACIGVCQTLIPRALVLHLLNKF